MKPATEQVIAKLNSSPLFQGGGNLDESKYVIVPSPEAAKREAASKKWDRFTADVAGATTRVEIQREVMLETRDEMGWIKMRELNGAALAQSMKVINTSHWGNVTRFPFQRILAGICTEVEVSHIISPIFFYPVVFPVLCAGHFPCGWDGEPIPKSWNPKGPEDMPKGKLMVHIISLDGK